jgi:acetyl-CoA carboxylase biotin carboxyl carrier protein
MKVNLDEVKQILDLMRENDLAEFEIEHEGLRLKLRKDPGGNFVALPAGTPAGVAHAAPQAMATAPNQAPTASAASVAASAEALGEELELAVVKSPIVGTFYRSSEPGAPPFVDVGSTVKKGQVLCIIEAMKLMNEIDSEYDGEIANVYVESGQPVQYGERLFAIRAR